MDTLQFQSSGDHRQAHVDVQTARQARALFLDHYLDIKREVGEEAALRVFHDLSRDLDDALFKHDRFHPRSVD